MERFYLALATLFFAGGFGYAVGCLRSGVYRHSSWNLGAMVGGLVFLSLFLGGRGRIHGRCPVTTVIETLLFVAWAMVIIYLLIGRTYRLSLMGVFTSPLVFLACLAGLLVPFDAAAAQAAAEAKGDVDRWVEMHKGLSLLAYGAFGMAFVSGLMFLVQDRHLRKGKLNAIFYNLPPIQHLATAVFRLAVVGTVLLTGGIIAANATARGADGHVLWPLYVVWLAYAALSVLVVVKGLPSRVLAAAAVGAFVLPLASLWVIGATS